MIDFQVWAMRALATWSGVAGLMRTEWVWPLAESLHFIGLSLLIGTVGVFDLRLLGVAPRIPAATLHRLVPWGVLGFVLNATTGMLFLMTEPDQYIFNPAFHFKMLFIAAAGLNALAFYLTVGKRTLTSGVPLEVPKLARVIGAVSLSLWLGVIIAGRLLTFFRPFDCAPGEARGVMATCVPQDR